MSLLDQSAYNNNNNHHNEIHFLIQRVSVVVQPFESVTAVAQQFLC